MWLELGGVCVCVEMVGSQARHCPHCSPLVDGWGRGCQVSWGFLGRERLLLEKKVWWEPWAVEERERELGTGDGAGEGGVPSNG